MAAEGLPALADDEGADVAERALSADRLPGHRLLLRAEAEGRSRRAWTRSIPSCCETYEKLGIPLAERQRLAGVAVDAVFDSVSVATTFKKKLAELGIIFCSFSEAVREHPDLVKKYLGSVVPYTDNYFAALNSAVFSDGSFCYIPKGVRCPMELSTYFRINAANTGQFERTLIVAEEGAYVSYLEGCTAPMRDENQLHAAVVELVALDNAQIKYSTVQNWYPGRRGGQGRHLQLRHQARQVRGRELEDLLDAGGDRLGHHLEVPELLLLGDNSVGEFYSVAVTNNYQQADTGTKMIHIGKNTRSTIVSKGISAGHGQNSYRGLVKVQKGAANARNFSQCDSLLLGDKCGAHTFPYIEVKNTTVAGGARGLDVEDRRGPDLLLQAARPLDGGRGEHDRERLLQGSLPGAADGVRGGSAEAAGREPGRKRRVSTRRRIRTSKRTRKHQCWKSQNLHAGGRRATRSSRHQPDGQPRAKCTPSWGRTARARARWRACWPGARRIEVTAGEVLYRGKDLLELDPEERAREGLFLAFQYPVEIPGVTNTYFLKAALNAIRKHRGLEELDAVEFLELVKEKMKLVEMDPDAAQPPRERGLLRRREEAERDLPDGRAASRRWRSWTRPIPAWTSTR